jgi:ATP-dependent protease ClpP protease subunit/phage head maturation protease
MARTMATITERRAAAELRRRQAGEAGERGGDAAFRQFRSQAPGVGRARTVSMPTELRAAPEERNGKAMVHTSGFFTRYERGYPMWDTFGEYEEMTARGSGAKTLASNPDVAFLVNHKGVTMARTRARGRDVTLLLAEKPEGGWHDAWINPERQDVRDFVSAVDDGLITEMSYAFMIPEGAGEWSDDFMTFRINEYDIDRGDVSGVNYGANPFTDIAAQTPDVLNALERLPEGALREAGARLAARGVEPRERIEVRTVQRRVDPNASSAVRALQGMTARTAARFVDLAERNQLTVAEVVNTQLPWYEIRERRAAGEDGADRPAEATDVFIYDEIGGSFGVDAKTFAEDLAAITTPQINIRFNSPGGSVFDGEAIHSSILHHPSHTTAYIDGLAASAASLIAIACDEIVTMPAGEWMLHDASMTTQGNAADHGKGQTYLDRHSNHLADLYGVRMGISSEEARQVMLDETWAFADEALTLGLSDRTGTRADMLPDADPAEERMAKRHDLSKWAYRHQGRAAAPAPRHVTRNQAAKPTGDPLDDYLNAPAPIERSSVPVATGRSIADIERALDANLI